MNILILNDSVQAALDIDADGAVNATLLMPQRQPTRRLGFSLATWPEEPKLRGSNSWLGQMR